jgi:hypothetical protein
MSRNGSTDAIAVFQRGTFLFMCITSVVCVLTLCLWVLGVPGVQNEYARGWALGLRTLYHYMIGSLLLLITYITIAKITQRLRMPLNLNLILIPIFWIFFIYSGIELYRALQIMLST